METRGHQQPLFTLGVTHARRLVDLIEHTALCGTLTADINDSSELLTTRRAGLKTQFNLHHAKSQMQIRQALAHSRPADSCGSARGRLEFKEDRANNNIKTTEAATQYSRGAGNPARFKTARITQKHARKIDEPTTAS
jgi:hypothetical protein